MKHIVYSVLLLSFVAFGQVKQKQVEGLIDTLLNHSLYEQMNTDSINATKLTLAEQLTLISTKVDENLIAIGLVNTKLDTLLNFKKSAEDRFSVIEAEINILKGDTIPSPPVVISYATDNDTLKNILIVQPNSDRDTVVGYYTILSLFNPLPVVFATMYAVTGNLTFIHSGLISDTTYQYIFRSKRRNNYSLSTPPVQLTTIDTTTTIIVTPPAAPFNNIVYASATAGKVITEVEHSNLAGIKWVIIDSSFNSSSWAQYKIFAPIPPYKLKDSITVTQNDRGIYTRWRVVDFDSNFSAWSNVAYGKSKQVSVAYSIEYYVSPFGNDNFSGLSVSSPFRTSTRAATVLNGLAAGSRPAVYFQKGGVWNEAFTVSYSGNPGQDLLIGSYGSTGTKPVLSGGTLRTSVLTLAAGVQYITIDGVAFRDILTSGVTGILKAENRTQHITVKNCDFSQAEIDQSQWLGMILMKDPAYWTIENCDFTGNIAAINTMANDQDSHNDVHHMVYNNNKFHKLTNRGALWFQQWFSGNPNVLNGGNGRPGTVLGAEGTYRDIAITNNDFDSLQNMGGVYWYRNMYFNIGWTSGGQTGQERQGYNWNISNNDFNLIEGAAIELAPLSNRWGQNHPETGVPIAWSTMANNRIDSTGYDYATNEVGNILSCGIETHGWKQVYIQDNYITWASSPNGDGHGINYDFSPLFNGDVACDSVVTRRNRIEDCLENNTYDPTISSDNGTPSNAGIHFAVMRKDNEVYDNIINNCRDGMRLLNWSMGVKVIAVGSMIANNTIYNCGNGFSTTTSGTYTIDATNRIVNNIFVDNDYGWNSASGTSIVTIPAAVKSNNLWFGNTTDFQRVTQGVQDVFGDPLFISAINKNFDVLTGGAGINTGAVITSKYDGVFTDFLLRTTTGAPDIGAYFFGGSNPFAAPYVYANSGVDSLYALTVTTTTATIYALINIGNQSTTARFQWDTDSNAVWANNQLADNSPLTINGLANRNLTGLTANTTYYYRAFVTNNSGSDTSYSDKFTTLSLGQAISDTLRTYVTAATNDGYNYGGNFYVSGDWLSAGNLTSARNPFLLFQVNLSAGEIVDSAYLFLPAYDTRTAASVPLNISLHDTVNSLAITTGTLGAAQYTARAKTSNVNWVTTPWTGGVVYQSVDISSLVQSVIDKAGWVSGNYIGVFLQDNSSPANSYRRITSYDYAGAKPQNSELRIYYKP